MLTAKMEGPLSWATPSPTIKSRHNAESLITAEPVDQCCAAEAFLCTAGSVFLSVA